MFFSHKKGQKIAKYALYNLAQGDSYKHLGVQINQ